MMERGMKAIKPPKFKRDWVGKYLVVNGNCLEGRLNQPEGTPLLIERRLNAQETQNSSHDVHRWGKIRILRLAWHCKACGALHVGYMPESWIEDGHAVFVEKE